MSEMMTAEMVIDRLEEASVTMRLMPGWKPRGIRASWPTFIQEMTDACGWAEIDAKQDVPTPDAITRMDEALEWLRWLPPKLAKLVWWRATRLPWRIISGKMRSSRSSVIRLYHSSIDVIVKKKGG